MKDMYQIAKYYESLGLCILPVAKGTKQPMVGWKSYQEVKPSDSELRKWFEGKTNQEIGMGTLCGSISNIIVCDDDYHDGNTHLGLASNVKVRTGNNGIHLFYKYTHEIGNRLVIDNDKIDFRSDTHFVVLPPTIHPNGNEYKWDLGDKKLQEVFEIRPVFPIKYVSEKLKEKHKISQPLDRLSVQFGNRDDSLFKELCSKVNAVDNFEEFVQLAYVINSEYKPPMDSKQVDIKIKSAWKYRSKPITEPIIVKKPKSNVEIADKIIEWKQLEKDAPSTGYENLDEVIKGFIPTHLYTLTGETNAGKTSLACNFAVNVALEGQRVLYIALEPDVHVASFLTGIFLEKNFDEITNEDYKIPIPNLSIVTQEDCPTFQHLEKIVEKYSSEDYKFIIIDHIGYFAQSENNYVQEQSQLIKKLALFTKKNKTAILLIAHPRKPQQQNTKKKTIFKYTANDIAGSVAFKQDSTEVMILHRLIDDMKSDDFNTVYKNEAIITIDKKKVSTVSNRNTAKIIFNPLSPKITEYTNYDMQREVMANF